MKLQQEITSSVGIGLFIALLVTIVGYVLDMYINPVWANFVALVVGLIMNFILQHLVFSKKDKSQFMGEILRYGMADVFILMVNQWLMVQMIHNEKEWSVYLPEEYRKYYLTLCRLLIGAIVWILISFPIRKYWVF